MKLPVPLDPLDECVEHLVVCPADLRDNVSSGARACFSGLGYRRGLEVHEDRAASAVLTPVVAVVSH